MSRDGHGLNLRSREEFLDYARRYTRTFLAEIAREGRPAAIEYIRSDPVPTGIYEQEVCEFGAGDIPLMGRGRPVGVMIAFRDAGGLLHFGWSLRLGERDEGTIIYERGPRARVARRRIVKFSRAIERNAFSKVEGRYRALQRALRCDPQNPLETVPTGIYMDACSFIRRFITEENNRSFAPAASSAC